MKRVYTYLLAFALVMLFNIRFVSAQDSTAVATNEAITDAFNSGMLIENQTTNTTAKGRLEFLIYHRFTENIKNMDNLFGLYGSSNIRLGFNYGITDKLTVNFGAEKNLKIYDFGAKYRIIDQTAQMPVSIAVYGNAGIRGGKKDEVFKADYKFVDRLSYFGQLVVAKKLNDIISFTAHIGYGHINKLDSLHQHDALAFGAGSKIKIHNAISAICEYSYSKYVKARKNLQDKPYQNLAVGMEIATSTHAFQVFATTYDKIVPQYNNIFTKNDFTDGKMILGFNITVKF